MGVFPYPLIDGIEHPTANSYPSYEQYYNDRIDVITNYVITINVEGGALMYDFTVNVGQMQADNVDKVLHVVLTESNIDESWYGGDKLHFVTRTMLPDQYGTPLLSDKGSNELFTFELPIDSTWIADSCELVAFIQDTVTKEIFQANSFLLVDVLHYDIVLEEISVPGNEFCGDLIEPEIIIRNSGYESIESCIIYYTINNEQYEYSWSGELQVDSIAFISLPVQTIDLLSENSMIVEVTPSDSEDLNPEDNILAKTFFPSQTIDKQQLILELQTDSNAGEISWELSNSTGEVVYSDSDLDNATSYSYDLNLELNDCFDFKLMDEGGNGICCEDGEGYYLIKDEDGNVYIEGGEFGFVDLRSFYVDFSTHALDVVEEQEIIIHPNPATDRIYIKSEHRILELLVFNCQGQIVVEEMVSNMNYQINTTDFFPGIYFIRIKTLDGIQSKRFIIK